MKICIVDFADFCISCSITERINIRLPPKEDTGESAALDFVKAVCHVLSLDSAVEETVYHLKGNLLKLIGGSVTCEIF